MVTATDGVRRVFGNRRRPGRDQVQQPCAPVRGQSGLRVIVWYPKASLADVVSVPRTVPGEAFVRSPQLR